MAANALISARASFPVAVCGILAVWRMRRGCQYLGRMRWQIVLTALVSSAIDQLIDNAPTEWNGMEWNAIE